MEFVAHNFVPLLFVGLLLFLLTGFPVAFSLAATGLTFGLIGIGLLTLAKRRKQQSKDQQPSVTSQKG